MINDSDRSWRRSTSKVDPQTDRRLTTISLGELARTKKTLLCAIRNVRRRCVPSPLDIALEDWRYESHFIDGLKGPAYFNGQELGEERSTVVSSFR